MSISIRKIRPEDNLRLAQIVRQVMEEFGVNRPNTVYTDPTTDALYELFQKPRSVYFVGEVDGEIAGGAGIFATDGLPDDVCELVKMWLLPEARGKGLGKILIENSMSTAKELGYSKIYLETMPELKTALSLYQKYGFRYLDKPMGNSGHCGCDTWMVKELD